MEVTSIPEAAILSQLERICQSGSFRSSRLVSNFLRFIVTESLQGRKDFLKEYTVGVNALGKRVGFNPQADASVRIHAGRLRKLLAAFYAADGAHDEVVIALPKGSYVPVIQPRLLVPIDTHTIDFRPTITIIPFAAPVGNDGAYVADGICEQLCTSLALFNEVSVVSYYSSRSMALQSKDLKEIGRVLDASYALTGQIEIHDGQFRLRVQLIAIHSLRQVWAKAYQKPWQRLEVFVLQDDIVNHIINEIAGNHGAVVRDMVRLPIHRQPADVTVYNAVFWYYYLVNDLNEEVYARALNCVLEAVRLDKRYALGWAILAEMYVAGLFSGYDTGVPDPLEEAVRCGTTAVNLDPYCHHAYQALGLAYLFRHEATACLAIADQWDSLNVDVAGVAGGLGFCRICAGQYEAGYQQLSASIRLNPFYPWWFNAGLSLYHYQRKAWEDAIFWAKKMEQQHLTWSLILQAAAHRSAGNHVPAKTLTEQALQLIDDRPAELYLRAFILPNDLSDSIAAILKE